MKKNEYFYLLILISLSVFLQTTGAASVKAMTFNIRFPGSDTGEDAWDARKEAVIMTVDKYTPDFLGLQEVVPEYVEFLEDNLLDDYDYFGRYRWMDGRNRDEACFLFYNKFRWEVVEGDSGTFQLSYTPDIPGSGGRISDNWRDDVDEGAWGNDARIVTWGRFREIETGMTLYVYNTHWDNRGTDFDDTDHLPGLLSGIKITERRVVTDPVIYMGDLNARQDDDGTSYLLGNGEVTDPILGDGPPIKMLDTDPDLSKIDHVFIMPDTAEVIEASRKSDRWDVNGYTQIRASDHWPTSGEFKFWHDTAHVIEDTLPIAVQDKNNAGSYPKGARARITGGSFTFSLPMSNNNEEYGTVYNLKGRRYHINNGSLVEVK